MFFFSWLIWLGNHYGCFYALIFNIRKCDSSSCVEAINQSILNGLLTHFISACAFCLLEPELPTYPNAKVESITYKEMYIICNSLEISIFSFLWLDFLCVCVNMKQRWFESFLSNMHVNVRHSCYKLWNVKLHKEIIVCQNILVCVVCSPFRLLCHVLHE